MTRTPGTRDRTRLMLGCASAAVALALALGGAGQAAAQGIRGTGNVVFGTAEISTPSPTSTQIDIFSPTVAINWTPLTDGSGNALDFLRTGATVTFQAAGATPFAVLNRILPAPNNNIAVIDGNVIARLGDPFLGYTPGGFVAFYSPTGILVGPNARFDVGRLMLTTLDTSNENFASFASGGFVSLAAPAGSRATVRVSPGAQITASPNNAFFAIIAADVEMGGTAYVNGSHAYIAGEIVNLRFSNGLFDISVPVGTAAPGEVVTLNGTIGGPASTGAADNHMIYAVARAAQDPISMLLSGNIGFDPAASASIVNGEIILAANYSVFGRSVAGGAVNSDIGAVRFNRSSANSTVRADITLQNVTATSSLLAIGTGRTLATSTGANSSFTGNLMLVGGQSALLEAQAGRSFTVGGDVLVDARDTGVFGSGLQSLDEINAVGGTARILASGSGALVDIGRRAIVTAEAYAGADTITRTAGTSRGGTAEVLADGGRVLITGAASVRASAFGSEFISAINGAEARGGTARLVVSNGGQASLGGDLAILSNATGSTGVTFASSTASNAFGGTAQLRIDGLGTVGIAGSATIGASATGNLANTSGAGALADAGEATIVLDGENTLSITGGLTMQANATGGQNRAGVGGQALGGVALATTRGAGSMTVSGAFLAEARATGGAGVGGGNAAGGVAGARAVTGSIALNGTSTNADASARGGNSSVGFGGLGGTGRGGTALFQAEGTASQSASLGITGFASLNVDGFGGFGGDSDITTVPGGRGGDGIGGDAATANQADATWRGGAYLLASGDYGQLTVGNDVTVSASARGGAGGSGSGTFAPGAGGTATGGYAQAGLAALGGPGTARTGTAQFGTLTISAFASGGAGGFDSGAGLPTGSGGDAQGGTALLSAYAGALTAGIGRINAWGVGGDGGLAGIGRGGTAAVRGGSGGRINAASLFLDATATGGFGFAATGPGGSGYGGTAGIEIDGLAITLTGDLLADATGRGQSAFSGEGGDGTGGTAYIATIVPGARGSLSVTGHTRVFANGEGATAGSFGPSSLSGVGAQSFAGGSGLGGSFGPAPFNGGGFAVGTGRGGQAYIDVAGGTTVTLGTAQITAIGRGGLATLQQGGDGFGGTVRLLASGSGSSITIQRNITTAIATESLAGTALLSADGIGTPADGGAGHGGNGRGGSVSLIARAGGNITLPSTPRTDPGSVGALVIRARGIGGASSVEGGAGGSGTGGSAAIEVDGSGSAIAMGDAEFTVFSEGGASTNAARNITGGAAVGGLRTISVLNGGSLTLGAFEGQSGARGGDGSGTGNGGNATSGRTSVVLNGGTLALTGILSLRDESTGGAGARGGDVLAAVGGAVEFSATGSTITFTPDGAGRAGITLDAIATGGAGASAGGSATAAPVRFTLDGTNLSGASLGLRSRATGGSTSGAGGTGGAATAGLVSAILRNATLGLTGGLLVASDALGGNGDSASGTGGTASAGAVDMQMTGGGLTLTAVTGNPADLVLRSRAQGLSVGRAVSQQAGLALTGSQITADQLLIQSTALANAGTNGEAIAGASLFDLAGASQATLGRLGMSANATGVGTGRAEAGVITLRSAAGSTARVDATTIDLVAAATNPASGAGLLSGQVIFELFGGSVNTTDFSISVPLIAGTARDSRIVADGGSLNVSGLLSAQLPANLQLRTGRGGVIGRLAASGNTTTIQIDAKGTIETLGDNSVGSALGGQSVSLLAGRSLLLGGALVARGGSVTLTANRGGGQPLASPTPAVITMAQGARINAGTGTVTLHLLDGAGDPQRASGAITLATINAGRIAARNFGTGVGTDIGVRADGVLTASGTGRAIDLASLGGEVINLAGDAGLILTGGGHYGIFAATPTGSQIGSFANYARRYNVATAEAYDLLNPGGNFAAFRIAPVLTVTANDVRRFYGSANPAFTASFTGFQPGDGVGDLAGTPQFSTLATTTSGIGTFGITAALGTLLSAQGYQFAFAPGTLTIDPRPITVTADSLSRIYGNANPALTFTVGGLGLVNGDQLTGALATTAGATTGVGNVAITQGSLAASANYALTFVNGQLTITQRPITITANPLSRIYGNANPALTFAIGGLGFVNGDQLTGALATTAGIASGIGAYAITQGTLTAGGNYAITFNPANLTITQRPITVTADSLSRIYGNANPALTFTVGGLGLVNGDQLTGALATTAGATTGIGNVAITQGTLAASANYALTFVGGQLTITPRPITITADSLSRFYGNANPALTFTVGGLGLVNGDQLTGALATTAGATTGVGNVAITQGTLAASANYALTFVNGQLTITPRPITITADNLSRIYGNANPALTFAIGGLGLVNGDQLTGALATTAGIASSIGAYAITQGTLTAGGNYALTYNPASLTITPRPITVTADSFSRIYGNANPALTFTVGGLGLVNGDQLTGALATTAGAATGVGSVAITQGSLAASANYALTFVNGQLTITPRPITVTADSLSRIYGNANPALTFTVGGLGLVNGDQLTGALATTAGATTGVGNVAITQGTLAASANYALTFVNGQLTITPRPITITADSLSRIYGSANPALTFTIGGLGLVNGDQLTGALATTAGAITGVGNVAITQGTLAASANYALTFVNGQLTITPRPITVTADSFSRIYGNANPALTFTVGGLGLVNGDQLTGALATTAGATTGVGNVAITQGTLAASANYALTFVNGQLTITQRPITITANPLTRIYGNANPALTFAIGGLGLVNGDQLTGALATTAGVASGVGAYAITQGTLTAGGNYAITFNPANLTITQRPITVTADSLSRIYGNANPALTFTVGGLGLVNGDQLTGALATTAGATTGIGNVAITQGTFAASANYALTFVGGQLTITPRPITIIADSLSRFYGNANPALTFTVGGLGLVNGDQLTGALATTAGATTGVGNVAITQGTLAASANYALTFVNGQLTITPRPITVTADSLSRIYGNANPALTFTVGGLGLVNGDQLTGALATTAGATTGVGNVAITQGTLAASANYALTFVNGQLAITQRPLTITANPLSRIYGNANPALTFTVGGLGLVNGDQLTGALATTAGATTGVGNVAITQGTLAASANYALTFVNGQLTITPRPITITADSLSRIYGNANPALTFAIGGLGLVNGDQLTGALATTAGATTGVGSVAITQGTLAASANYALTFVNGQLTITARPITITANPLSRIYGNANPALTFTVGGLGLVNGDQLTGALATTAGATTGVGNVAITQGTLAASANYALTFVNGQLTITPRPITITADSLSRIYGNANPALTFAIGGLGLVNGDQLTGALATTAGATTGVGSVAITQGSLAASANYALTFVGGQLTITQRPLTITANPLSRIYGNANPALTFTIGGLGLVNGDQLTGALATTAGATTGIGNVAITQGSLAASANYALTFVGGQLTITPRPITITANNLSKLLGLADPALTFTIGGLGLVNGDQLTGGLVRDAGEQAGSFAIRQGSLAASPNYALTYVGGALTITGTPPPSELVNPVGFEAPLSEGQQPPGIPDDEDRLFGIDFPEQPEAPLITEDKLLDDPVSSGGDSSNYGGTTPPPGGGQ